MSFEMSEKMENYIKTEILEGRFTFEHIERDWGPNHIIVHFDNIPNHYLRVVDRLKWIDDPCTLSITKYRRFLWLDRFKYISNKTPRYGFLSDSWLKFMNDHIYEPFHEEKQRRINNEDQMKWDAYEKDFFESILTSS